MLNTASPSVRLRVVKGWFSMLGVVLLVPYTKPHLTYTQQVELLIRRGMVINSKAEAARWLAKIGYYRLSGYFYPYREDLLTATPPHRADTFINGTNFDDVLGLYDFDRRFKLAITAGLERIEIAMRVRIGYTLGLRGPYAHLARSSLDGLFFRSSPSGGPSEYDTWLAKLDANTRRSKEDFVQHFKTKYQGRLPIWVATELLDFGGLSFLYKGLLKADRDTIAQSLGIVTVQGAGNGDALVNWMRVFNYLRNLSAHHSRLWNRNLTEQLQSRHLGALPPLAHLASTTAVPQLARPYSALAAIAFLLAQLNERSAWVAEIKLLLPSLDRLPHRSTVEMGFLPGWELLTIWQ